MKLLKTLVITLCLLSATAGTYAQKNNKTHETMILMETSEGTMKIKLYDGTPLHRDNFIKLAKEHFYDGLLFHRVIDGFMIQGGDKKGALAAARTGDQGNPQRRSSGSQFYIVHGKTISEGQIKQLENYGFVFSDEQKRIYETIGGTPTLDAQYTVFGEVVEGLDVVDKIAGTETGTADRPKKDVVIIKVSVVE